MAFILVVDDDDLQSQLARAVLARAGHVVETVCCAQDACARVAARVPDVIVTDINMPGGSGIELCRTLRERHPGALLRIVAHTSLATPEDLRAIATADFDAVLAKPTAGQALQDAALPRFLAAKGNP